jgi:hypothetical protein
MNRQTTSSGNQRFVGNATAGDSLVLVLGLRSTAEGGRGFQPTVGHLAKPPRRGATIEPSPHDQRSISFAPMPSAFHRRSATDGIDRSREECPPPQRGIPMSAQAIGLGHGRNHQGVAPTGRPSSSFVIVDDVFRVGQIESRPVGAV